MVLVIKKHATSSLEVFKNRLHFHLLRTMGLCLVVWDRLINTLMFSNHVFLKNNPNSKQNTPNDSQYEDALEKEEKNLQTFTI